MLYLKQAVNANDGNMLRNVAKEICLNSGTLCDGVDGNVKLVNFALIHLETFALLGEDSTTECVKSYSCVENLMRMVSEVFHLVERGEYTYVLDLDKYIKIARMLKEIE